MRQNLDITLIKSMIKIVEKFNRDFTFQNISSKRRHDRDRELEMKSNSQEFSKNKNNSIFMEEFLWILDSFLFAEKREIIKVEF